jgi:hypothetical protein
VRNDRQLGREAVLAVEQAERERLARLEKEADDEVDPKVVAAEVVGKLRLT